MLWVLGAGRAEPSPFLFRIIGMFMTVSGGLLADGARSPAQGGSPCAGRWRPRSARRPPSVCGVRSKRFGKQALALAAFDAAAAGLVAAVIARAPADRWRMSRDGR